MPIPLSVLIVEDVESDVLLLARLLKKADYELVYEQAETAAQMCAALEKQTWDIIISDYNLPQFDGQSALALLKETGLDIPFIVVSGKIGEETAVAMMKAGAQDYLLKDNLARFLPAVERELAQAELRRRRKRGEAALRESEDRYRTLVEFSPDSICIHCEGKVVYVNAATVKLFHAKCAEDIIGMSAIEFVHPDYRAVAMERVRRSYENRQPASLLEEKFLTLDNNAIEVEVMTSPIVYHGKAATQLIIRDISERKQVEEALVESETKFRWLYEYAPVAYHLLTPDGTITDINCRWCELLGYSREEVVGRSIFDFVVVDEKDEAKDSFEKKKESKQSFIEGSQRNFLTRNDAVKIFKTYDYFVFDQEQNITSVQTTIEDITERVQAEEALRDSQERLDSVLSNIERVAVQGFKSDGTVTFWNKASERFYGYTSNEMIGRDIIEWLHSPETRNDERQILDQSVRTGVVPPSGEVAVIRKDGSTVWVHASRVLLSRHGKEPEFFCFDVDITARKHAERSLREREEQYRTLVEQLPAIVFIDDVDVEGRTLYVSPQIEKLLGFTQQEWQAENPGIWSKQVHPDDFERVHVAYMRCFLYGEPYDAEYRITASDGRLMWFRDQAIMLHDENGNPSLIHGVMYDITERKQAEEATQTTNILLEQTLEQSPIPMVLVSMPDGIIRSVNSACRHFLGIEDEPSPVDMPLFDLKVSWQDFDMQGIPATAENLPLPGSLKGIKSIQERHIVRKDGTSVYGLVYGSPIFDTAGNLIAGYLVMTDITERKKAEEFVRDSEAKLRKAQYFAHVGSWIWNIKTNELDWSDEMYNIFGMDKQIFSGILSDVVAKSIHPDDRLKVEQANLSVINEAKPIPVEYRVIRSDGSERVVWGEAGELILDESGSPSILSGTVQDITERKQAEQDIRQRVRELEMLYQSGLALSQLLNPKEIGRKILELLEEKLNWYHTRIRLHHPQDASLELLDFNQPGLKKEMKRSELVERFQSLVSHSEQGMSGWVVQHGQPLRSGDVSHDPRYAEAYSGICSGLYVPMKVGERIIGVISIESEQQDAFSAADERLIVTLANQAASAFENARLFEETHQRVMELETLNRISLALRTVSKQDELLSIVLDEALAILNTSHGSVELYNKTVGMLEKTITRGWVSQMVEPPQSIDEGIAGRVFSSGQSYITREFASDPETSAASRSQTPRGWGGIFLPIRTTQQTLGVLSVSVPSEHELNKNEIRLLATLSEMTGAALQRMQLHEQTVRHLEQLNALRTVDQAIASSRDVHLTLNILLTHVVSQLDVDAADVLLFHPGSNLLQMVAGRGFHTPMFESASLSNSFAGRAIIEHRLIKFPDFQTTTLRGNPQFEKLWMDEGFACYWCVPLIVKGEVKGVLEVFHRTLFSPDAEWLEFLEVLAGQAAITIDNTQLFEYLQRANLDLGLAYDATIEGWSRAMDLRDHETEGHTLRVTELTVKLARAIHVSESQLTAVRRGALLHDIGKMGVPDSILLKEGKLTNEEWEMMRKHPQFAHDMLAPIAYLNDALDIPYFHHEKWDGTGYPQGLKGDRIPLVARIFAVVDVWDALTNDRTYRKRWTKQKARQYIKAQSGKHFDPQVVDVFLKSIK